tara:strand:+ start:61 stop:264 length:204 start_codon:yes stop_codon:yes gene_type:complete
MVFYGDITINRGHWSIFKKNVRKTPVLVLNNEYSNVDDPLLDTAKQAAIKDMEEDTTYIHPELMEGE